MGKTHFSGQVMETGVANSQAAVRTESLRTNRIVIPAGSNMLFTDSTDSWVALAFTTATNVWDRTFTATAAGRTPSIDIPISQHLWNDGSTPDTTGQLEQIRGNRITRVDMSCGITAATMASAPIVTIGAITAVEGTGTPVDTILNIGSSSGTNAGSQRVITYTPTTPISVTNATAYTVSIALAPGSGTVFAFKSLVVYVDTLL